MPDIAKAKADLATYITAGYSVSWAIAKVMADYRLWNHLGQGNAWIDDICKCYNRIVSMHQYV